MDSSGKVLTIILFIISILIITLLALSLWALHRETNHRKLTEATLKEYQSENIKLAEDLKEIKKQNFLLQEKNKEADERINDLSDELELEKGLREEMKIETVALKEQMEEALASKEALTEEIKAKEELHEQLTEKLKVSEQKIEELEAQLKEGTEHSQELGKLYEQQQEEISKLEEAAVLQETVSSGITDRSVDEELKGIYDENNDESALNMGVELGEIVVVPGESLDDDGIATARSEVPLKETVGVLDKVLEGRILSVDTETEFVIVSLGEMDGVEIGDVLSVYRNEDYVGDLRITRLQPEMAAADLVPPFSIRSVKKNDQVKVK